MSLPFLISIIFKLFLFTSYVLSEEQLVNNHDFHKENAPIEVLANESSLSNTPETTREIIANISDHYHHHRDHQFDFLMFTQLWPISNCIDWEERGHDHTCTLNG